MIFKGPFRLDSVVLWLYNQLIFVLGRARTEPHCVFSDIFSKRKPLVPIS